MKKIIHIFLLPFTIISFALTSCSNDDFAKGGKTGSKPAFDFSMRAESDPVQLDYACYLFRSASGSSFELFDVLDPLASGTELPWNRNELKGYSLRFLFVALPTGTKPLKVVDGANNAVSQGISWEDVGVKAVTLNLPLHCYYGVEQIEGDDLVVASTLSCTLDRIVGRMVFDFYKVDPDDVSRTPIGINTSKAVSVMDRVSKIEVTYSGLADRLVFDTQNTLVPSATAAPDTTQVIKVNLSDKLGAAFPQDEGSALTAYDASVTGSARINGFYMLPSDDVKASILFTYYSTTPMCNTEAHVHDDTCIKRGEDTPSCGKEVHIHDAECYEHSEQIILNIPAGADMPLSVIANHITRNKAMIRCDRVIDVPYENGFGFDVEWGVK